MQIVIELIRPVDVTVNRINIPGHKGPGWIILLPIPKSWSLTTG